MASRFTFEEVRDAYQQTGLTPKPGITFNGKCACPISAIYVQRRMMPPDPETILETINTLSTQGLRSMMEQLGLSLYWAFGVVKGFDDQGAGDWDNPDYLDGYALGVQIREELVNVS